MPGHVFFLFLCNVLNVSFSLCSVSKVVSLESRSLHLSTLVQEAEQRVNDLTAQVVNELPSADGSEKEKQLKAWEWRYRLYKRMNAGFEHARKCLK